MSDLNVDVTPMGGGAGVISAGTAISSHYVFYDPKTFIQQIGSVFFDTNVIGIITSLGTLAASDFLGAPGTIYNAPALRGLEAGDSALIDLVTPNRINVDWKASSPGDYIRVITSSPVPVPAAFWLFGSAILATIGWSRKKSLA